MGKASETFAKSLKIWANPSKYEQKWCPKQHKELLFGGHFFIDFFRGSLGEFGQKSFATPIICLLLHICLAQCLPNFLAWCSRFLVRPPFCYRQQRFGHGPLLRFNHFVWSVLQLIVVLYLNWTWRCKRPMSGPCLSAYYPWKTAFCKNERKN